MAAGGDADVLGVGAVTIDDLPYVEEHPQPQSKTRVEAARPGGQAGIRRRAEAAAFLAERAQAARLPSTGR